MLVTSPGMMIPNYDTYKYGCLQRKSPYSLKDMQKRKKKKRNLNQEVCRKGFKRTVIAKKLETIGHAEVFSSL